MEVMQIRRTRVPNNPPTDLWEGQLAVEMASNPPRLWVGVPSTIDPSARRLLLQDFTTGDVKLAYQQDADPGWVMADDGSIGDELSGATTRADDDCEALFKLFWGLNTGLVIGGAGATAEDDWNAHKQINLPRVNGRGIAIAGQGAGLTNRLPARSDGAETVSQVTAQAPSHQHTAASWGGGHTQGQNNLTGNGTAANFDLPLWQGPVRPGFGTNVGAAMNVMNPRAYINMMIKL